MENPTRRALTDAIERRLYSLGEAALVLGVDPSTIKKAEIAGRLPPARRDEGGDRFYVGPEVEALGKLLAGSRVRSRS